MPGCGGTVLWMNTMNTATGMPIATGPRCPAAFAKAKMIGTRMMKATSKKIGIATRPEAISSACARRFSPSASAAEWAMTSAPPVRSMIPPSIAPSPTSRATLPSVPPMPSINRGTTSWTGMPPASAVSTATPSRATKAGHLSLMTVNSRIAIAPAAMPTRRRGSIGTSRNGPGRSSATAPA